MSDIGYELLFLTFVVLKNASHRQISNLFPRVKVFLRVHAYHFFYAK